jgi:uncharacterized tellurite resistance protein B-like protein
MLDAIRTLISQTFGTDLSAVEVEHTIELSAAVLLIEVALSDAELEEAEHDQILASLQESFALTDWEVARLVDLAHEEHGRNSSFHPFIRVINESLEQEEKFILIRALWRVALSDNHLDKYEESQLRKIADWLYIPHRDFIRAKLEVQSEQ